MRGVGHVTGVRGELSPHGSGGPSYLFYTNERRDRQDEDLCAGSLSECTQVSRCTRACEGPRTDTSSVVGGRSFPGPGGGS